ncbi:preprotein translocase subunit SecA [Patescibacteria group bacterium]|nr:preprotein translocase subunit SecA [Patescibacteria group bacterium]
MNILSKIFGDPNEKIIKSIEPLVAEINNFEDHFVKRSNEELAELTAKLMDGFPKNNDVAEQQNYLNSILTQAFALAREASKRTLGQRHFDVQLIGGVILHRGQIAEMKTGEGKTLVATLPLFLNALSGKGVHLVTVNDYLARVGAGWMAPVYHLLGLSTGVIAHDSAYIYDPNHKDESEFDIRLQRFKKVSRKQAYNCHIVYGTNNEFGFDYLRDNMAPTTEAIVQRSLYYAIVDEVDSILIDEARTPLIISAQAEDPGDKYHKFAKLVAQLEVDKDYNLDEKMRAVTLTDEGIKQMEKWLGVENIYTIGGIREVHHIEQALKAHVIFKKDKDYVVRDNAVVIVDEFTGRLMEGRRYSDGLHQAIEAKENVEIKRESLTLATITFQNYFRMYGKLAGMTGTALTEAEEFSKIYNLETVSIPTHRQIARIDQNDLIYATEEGKHKAIIADIKDRNQKGQPILIGTISIQDNERLALTMEQNGLNPQLLNAKNHIREAQIIAGAGKIGAITLATNMAGRGVDIMLGGPEPEKNTPEHDIWQVRHDEVIKLGGLHVIGTERHESRRIDNQLRGRAGRQGDPGSSVFYISTDDDLMRIFGGDRMKKIMTTLRLPEDMPIENKIISKSIESAQKKVEGNNFDMRKHLVEYDDVINRHREAIYEKRRNILNISETYDSSKLVDPANKPPRLTDIILEMVECELKDIINFHTRDEITDNWNFIEIAEVCNTIFRTGNDFKEELNIIINNNNKDIDKARTEIINYAIKLAYEKYNKILNSAKEVGIAWIQVEKSILIRTIDSTWIDHLSTMSSLRQGIGLRGYGQRDPLVEYKKESFRLYQELNNIIQKEIVYNIYKISELEQFQAPTILNMATQFIAPVKTSDQQEVIAQPTKAKEKTRNENGKKVGRNDACPCGSGKKFKRCCGT